MNNFREMIEREIGAFLFEERKHIDFTHGEHIHQSRTWGRFLETNKRYIEKIIETLLNPEYFEHNTLTQITHPINLTHPDIGVCEYLCCQNEKIIHVCGIKKNNEKLYIAISQFGSVVIKTPESIILKKCGTTKYSDGIINLIKLIKCYDSLDTWMEILEKLDAIQKNIIIYCCMKQV